MGPVLFLAGVVCFIYVLAVVAGQGSVAASKPLRKHSPIVTTLVAVGGIAALLGGIGLMAGWWSR